MAYEHRGDDPVHAPNSFGRGYADEVGEVDPGWEADGAMVRQACTLRPDDDDFSQAGTLVRDVWDDDVRANFVKAVAGRLLGGVGKRIKELVRAEADLGAPGAQDDKAKQDASDPVVETDTRAGH